MQIRHKLLIITRYVLYLHTMNLLDIASRIQSCRKAKGLSQTELGRLCGVDRSIISKLESHKLGDIGYNKIERIFNALEFELVARPASPLPTLTELQEERRAE